MTGRSLTVVQMLPELDVGGVERGTVEIAQALRAAGHRALVVSAPGRLVDELEACGAEHVPLAIGAKRPRSLAYVGRLARLYAEVEADVVHARSRLPAWLGRFALNRISPARRPAWVTTVHGPYTVNLYSAVMTSGDAVIAISDFIRDYVLASYPSVPATRITVIPRGADRARFPNGYTPAASWRTAFEQAFPGIRNRRLLTLPARLTRWKGQLDFIALIARLRAHGLPVHGLLAGAPHPRKAAYERELRREVVRHGLTADVSFLGHRDDLRDILAVSDIAYSLTRQPEAFGRTTVEALSLGTPVIGYDHGGTGEVLRSIFPAGLAAPGDVAHAARLTEAMLATSPVVPKEHPYTVERMQQETVSLYERVAARTR